MTLGSVVKVVGSEEKEVQKSPTGRYTYRQDVKTTPTRCRVVDVYFMASH